MPPGAPQIRSLTYSAPLYPVGDSAGGYLPMDVPSPDLGKYTADRIGVARRDVGYRLCKEGWVAQVRA